MSTPSLLCVPYRLKAGTLYSQIPDSGLGDFNVTRSASNSATRVNSRGLIETVLDNVPRLDYPLGGITAGCPALLVEPSAQNICLQSADFNTTWTAQNSATVNTNTAISPDGTQNADTINLAAISDSRVRQLITVANSTTYTMSCFYKNIALTAGQAFRMRFNGGLGSPNNFIAAAVIDLAAGTATYSLTGTSGTGFSGTATGRIENYGNGWYRVSVTFTVGTGGGAAGLFEAANVDAVPAVRSFYAWGAQLEASSVPTSYIPTVASSVTRGAETISKTGVSSLIGQTEGTIYAEVVLSNNSAGSIFLLDNGSTSTFLNIVRNTAQNIQVTLRNGGGTIATIITSSALANGVHKIALSYTNGAYSLYINGSPAGTSTNSTDYPASLTRASISVSDYGAPYFPRNDRIRAHSIYPTRLPNTGPNSLQSLTQ